jgi:hypothetical protein
MKAKHFYAFSLIGLLLLGSVSTSNGMLRNLMEKTVASWKTQTKNIGKIPQNTPAIVEFDLTNGGKTPLVIKEVTAGCSCTVADYPKDPIMPGKSGKIKATYNAAALGPFTKSVTVKANTEPEVSILTFSGEVVAAK